MPLFNLYVPGYAAIPERGGPNVFGLIGVWPGGADLPWTDQGGLRGTTDVEFRGRAGVVMDFHFPFTTPARFNPSADGAPTHMRFHSVMVTFFRRDALKTSDSPVVNRIRVYDRRSLVYDTQPRFGDLNMPNPSQGENAHTFEDQTIQDRNLHTLNRPVPVHASLGVTVTVNFVQGGRLGFTGAGVQLV